MGDPKRLTTPATSAGDDLFRVLQAAINPGKPNPRGDTILDGQSLGDWISKTFNLPSYGGELSAPVNATQTGAQAGLNAYVPGMVGNIESASKSLADIASSGSIDDIYKKLDDNRRLGLARDLNDTREQFSSAGLRNSTAFANASGVRQSESEAGLNSSLAQIIPQLLSARTAAASAIPGLASAGSSLFKDQYGVGADIRNINDTGDVRKYQDFINQRGLLESLIAALTGQKADYAPSTGQQIGQGLVGAGTIAAALA